MYCFKDLSTPGYWVQWAEDDVPKESFDTNHYYAGKAWNGTTEMGHVSGFKRADRQWISLTVDQFESAPTGMTGGTVGFYFQFNSTTSTYMRAFKYAGVVHTGVTDPVLSTHGAVLLENRTGCWP